MLQHSCLQALNSVGYQRSFPSPCGVASKPAGLILSQQLPCQAVEAVPYSSQHGLPICLEASLYSGAHVHHALHAVQHVKPVVRCGTQHCPQAPMGFSGQKNQIHYELRRSKVTMPSLTQTSPTGGQYSGLLMLLLFKSRRQTFANSHIGTTLVQYCRGLKTQCANYRTGQIKSRPPVAW